MTHPASNQRGIALLTVLGLLALLLVLAAIVADSSRMEAALSGVGKDSARAFSAAEAGLDYGLSDVNNFTSVNSLNLTCSTVTGLCPTPPCFQQTDLATAGLSLSGYVHVCFDREGPPPTSIKVSALRFKAFQFDLDSRGNAPPNGATFLQMQAARLGPAQ